MAAYHDEEWGVPVRESQALFERLTLEAFQSGLSWRVVLAKRPAMRRVFADFRIDSVAAFDDKDVERLLQDDGIIRNRRKIEATIGNARACFHMESEGISLGEFVWRFAPEESGKRPESLSELPSQTQQSEAMAKALKAVGFSFLGPVTCYAFMQSVGIVDDHLQSCFVAQERGAR